jgi:5-methylthioadenosine/S-adenosylhomocysteine deaminase
MGIRAAVGSAIIDFLDPSKAENEKRRVEEEIVRFGPGGPDEDPSGKVALTIAPHALYTVSAETLRWVSEKAQEHGMALHIHLSETEQEVKECLKTNGMRPTAWLEAQGVLGPHCIAAHGIWLDEDELDLLAERKVTVVHNPASNMKTSAGSCFPYRKYHRRGIGMMLGTDGCASNNALDLFSDARLAGLLQKHHSGDPTIFPAPELMDMLTGAASRPASGSGVGPFRTLSGKLEPGAPADFILLDLSNPRLIPLHNPLSNIAYAADGGCVDTVVCGGKVLMAGGEVPGEKAIVAEAAEAAKRLVSRQGISSTL